MSAVPAPAGDGSNGAYSAPFIHRHPAAAAACTLAALVVAAWFGLGIHQATSGSSFLNPDRQVDLDRSARLNLLGHRQAARRLALSVARAEPQNVQAWLAVGASAGHDRRLERTAITHVLRLDPLH